MRGAGGRDLRLAGVALDQQLDPLAELLDELGRADDPRVLAEAEHPGDQLTGVGVGGDEQPIALVLAGAHLAVAAEMALDLPGDPCR